MRSVKTRIMMAATNRHFERQTALNTYLLQHQSSFQCWNWLKTIDSKHSRSPGAGISVRLRPWGHRLVFIGLQPPVSMSGLDKTLSLLASVLELTEVTGLLASLDLASDWSISWPGYWPLIGLMPSWRWLPGQSLLLTLGPVPLTFLRPLWLLLKGPTLK